MTRVALAAVLAVMLVGGIAFSPSAEVLQTGKAAPEIAEGAWINSAPLSLAGLRGRVVLLEFWTYG